ncbi:MAG TPA: inorganic phosphate transporter [Acidimicrobiales bacterium]|jgi:PiT family inorganic phosphate transporter
MTTLGLVFLILVALGFDFTNGFHDAANAVAVSITTRALKPLAALGLAASLNVVGALISTKVAATVGSGIIATPKGTNGLVLVFAALVGGIGWNLLTWWFGLPSSSTHALIGGLVGAALAGTDTVKWGGLVSKVIVPMAVSPAIGLALGFTLMIVIMWLFRRMKPNEVNRRFRHGELFSTSAMAFSHGTQDAQKTMGVIALALVVTGHLPGGFSVPLWVILAAASAMGLGTLAGGWRVIRTLGSRITPLDPPRAFAAQTAASTVLLVSAYAYAIPISSTHLMTSSVMGVGATRRLTAVRWGLGRQVVMAWIFTLPGAAVTAWVTYHIAHLVVR